LTVSKSKAGYAYLTIKSQFNNRGNKMQRIFMGFIAIAVLMVSCEHSTFADSYTAEDASTRDNKDAWKNVLKLKAPAYELTSMDEDFMPGYMLFHSGKVCDGEQVRMQFDTSTPYIATECHRVGPKSKLSNFWNILVLKDGKRFTEARFHDRSQCVSAAADVRPKGNVDYVGICVNSLTQTGTETGE
jgi:hypothetical protein